VYLPTLGNVPVQGNKASHLSSCSDSETPPMAPPNQPAAAAGRPSPTKNVSSWGDGRSRGGGGSAREGTGRAALASCASWNWNALPGSGAMAHVTAPAASSVGRGGLELEGVNGDDDALSCSPLETSLIMFPLALPAALALLAGGGSSSPASCRLITRHSA
jgi:hypothetical protein